MSTFSNSKTAYVLSVWALRQCSLLIISAEKLTIECVPALPSPSLESQWTGVVGVHNADGNVFLYYKERAITTKSTRAKQTARQHKRFGDVLIAYISTIP
jgi:hypothetical protein